MLRRDRRISTKWWTRQPALAIKSHSELSTLSAADRRFAEQDYGMWNTQSDGEANRGLLRNVNACHSSQWRFEV